MLLLTQMAGFGRREAGLVNLKSLALADVAETLTRTQGAGASRRKMTFSFFVRTAPDVTGGDSFILTSVNSAADKITVGANVTVVLGSGLAQNATALSDSTFYHVKVEIDTANATAGSRCKIFINGVDDTSILVAITQNYDTGWGLNSNTETLFDSTSVVSGSFLVDELAKIDNAIVAASSFASGGHPIDLSALTFGTQGYWLRFETGVNTTVGNDSSGNGLNFTNNNFDNADFSSTVP